MHSFMTEKCSQVLRKALLVVNYINTSNFFPSNKPIKDKQVHHVPFRLC